MGCGSSKEFPDDEPRTVVVFGATGLLGGAVARALLEDPLRFRVRAVTRRPSSEKARKLAEEGIDKHSLTMLRLLSCLAVFPTLCVLINSIHVLYGNDN